MQVVHEVCCGLDVHKKSVTACVLWASGRRRQTRVFGTFTKDLLALGDWLRSCGVTHVALESTGVYGKPVWNLLEGQFEVLLVNAQHIKAVPGRKTDQKDSEWIADLLQHGLLRASFVPPTPIRELRDLTRYRASLSQEINRIANRIQKVLEDANIKLSSVATNTLGASSRTMLGRSSTASRTASDSQRCPRGNCKTRFRSCSRPWKDGSLGIVLRARSIKPSERDRPWLRRTRVLWEFNRGKKGCEGARELCGKAQRMTG